MERIVIRTARLEDAGALIEIYAPYVKNTAITFEYDVPTIEEFQRRIERVLSKYPYLVAERDGEIVGYAYASPFHERPACDWAVEVSIYVRQDKKKLGIGKALYEELERLLRLQKVLNVNASIAYSEVEDAYLTKNSIEFHEHLGYKMVGEFHKCGFKFHRWYSLVWMEKHIGEHTENPKPVRCFKEIREELDKL